LSNVTVDTPTITGPFSLPAFAPDTGTFRINPNTGGNSDAYTTLGDGPTLVTVVPPAADGPSAQEAGKGRIITGTSQAVHPGTPACDKALPCVDPNGSGGTITINPNTSTFGQAGGVFTNGISPGNYTNQGVAASYIPYSEPIYDTSSNSFTPFGGPPAFDTDGDTLGLRDGLSNLGSGVLGIPLGITTFAGVTTSPGAYKLSLQIPTGFAGQTPTFGTVSASATMGSNALLGTILAPTLILDGLGGGSFTVASFPSGVTEEIVEITDFGNGTDTPTNCQGSIGGTFSTTLLTNAGGAGPVYYTILVKAPGSYSLPDTIGPNTTITQGPGKITPSPSICTAAQNTAAAGGTATPGDTYSVQAIGADYPLFESLYPNSKSQTPSIVGANGQADITISAVSGTLTSSSRFHRTLGRVRH